jgi:uncharacterized membrane protein YhaH (DUF805 family)
MDLSHILFSFEGRINRAKWWLAGILLAVAAIILTFLAYAVLGLSLMTAAMTTTGSLVTIVITALIAYPATALMLKRLNDRDRPSWLVAVFWAPTVVMLIAQLFGLTMTVEDIAGIPTPQPTALGWVINLASLAIGIWALIELGILRGTEGPNRHGPDPLAK